MQKIRACGVFRKPLILSGWETRIRTLVDGVRVPFMVIPIISQNIIKPIDIKGKTLY